MKISSCSSVSRKSLVWLAVLAVAELPSQVCDASPDSVQTHLRPNAHQIQGNQIARPPAPNTFSTTSPVPFRSPDPGVPIDSGPSNISVQHSLNTSTGPQVQPLLPAINREMIQTQLPANLPGGSVTQADLAPGIRAFEMHRNTREQLQEKILPTSTGGSNKTTSSAGKIPTESANNHQLRTKSNHNKSASDKKRKL